MVTYDVFRAHDSVVRAVDGICDGLWNEVASDRDDIIVEAKARLDDAAQLLTEKISEELHPYVSSEDVAYLAAALALRELEGWDVVVETALSQVEQEAAHWYQVDLTRGD